MATPALTIGESLARVSRRTRWTAFAIPQIMVLVVTLCFVYGFEWTSPSFFSSVPRRLPLLLSWGVYMSLLFLIRSCMGLFLPRAPVAVYENLVNIGMWAVGLGVIGLMMLIVRSIPVDDSRILMSCTCIVAAFIVALVALWVWLARTSRGGDPSESSTLPAAEDDSRTTSSLSELPV